MENKKVLKEIDDQVNRNRHAFYADQDLEKEKLEAKAEGYLEGVEETLKVVDRVLKDNSFE